MFGSLKKLFSRQAAVVPPPLKSTPVPAPAPKPSTPPAVRPAGPAATGTSTAARPAPLPAPMPPAPSPSPSSPPSLAPGSSSHGSVSGEKLVLALKSVVARIPADLMPLVKSTSGNLEFPLQRVLDQLPQGSVRFSLAEIRDAAASGTFGDIAAYEKIQVELPLQTILSLIGPSAFARRAPVKRLRAPAEVGDLFGPRGESKTLSQTQTETQPAAARPQTTTTPLSTTTPAVADAPAPKPLTPSAGLPKPPSPLAMAPSSPIKPVTALPTPPLPKPAAPALNAPTPALPAGSSPAISGAKLPPPSPTQTRLPVPPPSSVELPRPAAPAPSSAIPRPPAPPSLPKPLATPAPLSPSAKSAAAPALLVALPDISGGWPEVVRTEIVTLSREQSLVALPFDLVDRGLRSGRLLFTWKQIGEWLKPEPITASPHGEEMLELPLAVIAPRYLAQFKPNRTQKKIVIGANIPDIFGGQQRKAPSQPFAGENPVAAARSPVSQPVTAPVAFVPPSVPLMAAPVVEDPLRVAAPAVQSVAELFGQPGKQVWSFNEIVQGTVALPGVSGAVLGSEDGLLVAGQLPSPLSGETVAAFLPQMFGRISQYSTELKAGDLTVITLSFGPVSWQILRTGELYFAAMGKPGEVLPAALLATIATELGRQKK